MKAHIGMSGKLVIVLFMGAVVVENHMNLPIGRNIGNNIIQKRLKSGRFLAAVVFD